MVKSIEWNKRALRKMRETVAYLKTEFSDNTANKYVDNVYDVIERLKDYPFLGRPVVTTKTVRFIGIDEHRQMFYRLDGTTLYISNFFDTRQDPYKRPY